MSNQTISIVVAKKKYLTFKELEPLEFFTLVNASNDKDLLMKVQPQKIGVNCVSLSSGDLLTLSPEVLVYRPKNVDISTSE